MPWHRFVAVGDSFTEGLDDPYPDGTGLRGWADLVAERLSAELHGHAAATPPTNGEVPNVTVPEGYQEFCYANLAVRGRLFESILTQQVPSALEMKPDIVSLAAGANDVVRQLRLRLEQMAELFLNTVNTIRQAGADVVVFRWAHPLPGLPARRVILRRLASLNEVTDRAGREYGAKVVDLWSDREFDNPALWSRDRFHMSPAGHRRIAARVLETLNAQFNSSWLESPSWPASRPWLSTRASDVWWMRQHLRPWLHRRLTGRSTGDNLTPKRPVLTPLRPADE